jgi:hypothetical protein
MTTRGSAHSVFPFQIDFHTTVYISPARESTADCHEAVQGVGVPPVV